MYKESFQIKYSGEELFSEVLFQSFKDNYAWDYNKMLRLLLVILENTGSGIIVADQFGNIIFINSMAIGQLSSSSDKNLRPKTIFDLLEKKDARQLSNKIQKVINEQKIFYEKCWFTVGNQKRWFELTVAAFRLISKNRTHRSSVVILLREITERKCTEQALQRSEKRYRAVIEAQTELISRWRPDFTRTFINEAYCRYLGKSREELLNKSILDLMQPKEKEQFRQEIKRLTQANPILTNEKTIIMPNGETRWQEWNERAIFDDSKKLVEFQSVGRDITPRKEMELKLKNSKEVLKAQKAALEQKNIALREILEQVGAEKKMIKDEVLANIEHLLLPILEKIKSDPVYSDNPQMDLLEKNVRGLVSSFGKKISQHSLKLTPREIEICDMIKHGLSNKEMAKVSHISVHTIETHRENIRRKLNLRKKKINLGSFLKSL